MAKANPFRFSTKYQDDETDLLYYGYRYYSASIGRWLNRDPLQELGGLNIYGFADDDAIDKCDSNGRELIEAGEAIIADLAVQITLNYATGEHWYHISVASVATAAGLGLIGIPDIKDTGQLVGGLFKAGKISATASKQAYELKLLSNAKSIAKLNAKLDKMTVEQSKVLMQTLKTGGLIAANTAATTAVAKIADAAETGIITMPGCPNPGYGGIANVNIVERVYYVLPQNTAPPVLP
jgi:RHS repeat-associated protein